MWWSDKTAIILLGVIWILLKLRTGVGREICPEGFFTCHDGECIHDVKHCDNHPDCKDRSDEFDCDAILCKAPHWYRCTTGLCISSSFRCDGDDDCGDWSDEDDCHNVQSTTANCSRDEWRCVDNNCILAEWVCDGKQDCMDGSDELQGCSYNISCFDGFRCGNGHCIPHSFRCDGSDDCGDKSDEEKCPTEMDVPPEECTLLHHLILCDDKEICIQLNELCDGEEHCHDGSDEGPRCNESKVACTSAGCDHRCVPSPHGPMCICQIGYNLVNRTSCVDEDECLEYGICDQKCKNSPGAYSCYCDEGYKLDTDKRSCRATGADALLLFSSTKEIRGLYFKKEVYFEVANNLDRAVGLSYDGKHVFWTELMHGEEAIVRSREDGSHLEAIVTAGVYQPEDLAADWITGNIYFTDVEVQHIGVCLNNGSTCTVLINEDIDKPRAIALLPTEGLMYWTDWGEKPLISKAGMDGSKPEIFISAGLHYPNGLTIDQHNSRLYWVDAKILAIESVKLDGTDRRVVLKDVVKHPFAVAMFEDTLYWSDWHGRDIQSCNKFTGKNHKVIVREKSKNNFIYGLHIYHPSMMPTIPNPCLHAGCSDICLLAPNRTYSCACPEHKIIGADKHTCHETTKQELMIVAIGNKLTGVGHQFLGRQSFFEMPLRKVHDIGAVTYNSLAGNLIIYDSEQQKLFLLDMTSMKLSTLVSDVGHIDTMDFDYVGNNLYWCDGERATIEILSMNTMQRTILLHSLEGEVPLDVALVPEEGVMFVAFSRHGSSDDGPHIDRLSMDGKGERTHVAESGLDGPIISLFYDPELHRIFWTDPNNEEIVTVAVDGMDQHQFRTDLGSPFDVSSLSQDLFWTDWGHPYLYWVNKFFGHSRMKRLILDVPESKKMRLVAVRTIRTKPDHPCQKHNGGCSHICAAAVRHMVCLCPVGLELNYDKRTCSAPARCSGDTFKCKTDNFCIPNRLRCDGKRDCPNGGEDELDCDKVTCSTEQFTCENGQCISIGKRCNGDKDCTDGSDELECEEECLDFQCASGECIDKFWHCDGNVDCADGSDEENCADVTCPPSYFKCKAGACIPNDWVCDGNNDCIDRSDEQNCGPVTCRPETFSCNNGRCIDTHLLCNGIDDCGDRSDEDPCKRKSAENATISPVVCKDSEFGCKSPNNEVTICVPQAARCNGTAECPHGDDERNCEMCEAHQFKCRNGLCISADWVCDGSYDCSDYSDEDEEICSHPSTKGTPGPCTDYSCISGQCVPLSLVCNKMNDCSDGSDENGQCDSSCRGQHPCEDICHPTPRGPRCSCGKGYILLGDGSSCGDVNECERNDACAQECQNTRGSFNCYCDPGFQLSLDRVSCKALGQAMEFIFAAGHQIRKVSHELRFTDVLYPDTDLAVTGLDVDAASNTIYWSIGAADTIYEISLQGGRRAYMTNIGSPGDIAVDWITHNVYFVETSALQSIRVCNLETQLVAKVIDVEYGFSVSKIAVDPISGYLFWAEVSKMVFELPSSELFRSDLSGENKITIAREHMMLVSGLVLDLVRKRVYIADRHMHAIESMSYEGEDRRIVLHSEHVQDPMDLNLFEGRLYWLTGGSGQLTSYKLYGPPERRITKLQLYAYNTEQFTILQSAIQPKIANPCANHTCEGMCVVNPGNTPGCLHTELQYGHVATSEKPEVKAELSGSSSVSGVLIGIFVFAAIIALMLGLYCYRQSGYRSGKLNFSFHFQNPSFGLRSAEDQDTMPVSKRLVPGQHQYANPFDGSGVIEHPEGKVLILSGDNKKKSPVILGIPRQPSEPIELEDDLDEDYTPHARDDMKIPLIP